MQELPDLEVGERRVGHGLHILDPLAGEVLRLERARVLDRERGAVGDELEQLDLVVLEIPRDERADVEDAGHLSLHDQRHAEHRLDPLLAQDRVEDVCVVDVVEDDRPLLGGDAAGKAAADGDADTLLDLLLDAERGACDELVRLLVEQKDRARVDLEDQPCALEQRAKEVVEPQMRERGVGDGLQPSYVLGAGSLRPQHTAVLSAGR